MSEEEIKKQLLEQFPGDWIETEEGVLCEPFQPVLVKGKTTNGEDWMGYGMGYLNNFELLWCDAEGEGVITHYKLGMGYHELRNILGLTDKKEEKEKNE